LKIFFIIAFFWFEFLDSLANLYKKPEIKQITLSFYKFNAQQQDKVTDLPT